MNLRHLFDFLTTLLLVSEPTTMTSLSTKDAVAAFPHPTLTPIATSLKPPTYASIKQAQMELNGNAASVPSLGGDGLLGHLALTITPAQYILLYAGNVPFVAPSNLSASS
jgi:hypothetical protein